MMYHRGSPHFSLFLQTIIIVSSSLLFGLVRSDTCSTDTIVSLISGADPNFAASNGNSFVTCSTSSDLVVVDSSADTPAISLGITNDGCPASCDSLASACSEYSTVTQTQYGTYQCKIKAQNDPGVISSCYFATNSQGLDYQEIYFQFFATNNTQMHLGFYANGVAYPDQVVALTFMTDADFHTYTMVYQENYIVWYVDGVRVLAVTPSYPGQYNMPNLPGTFRVNYITSSGSTADVAALGVYNGIATSIEIANISFVPAACGNSGNFSSESTSSSDFSSSSDANLPPWSRPCTKVADSFIYADTLAAGVTDTSKTQHSLTSNSPVHDGTASISWNVEEGALFSLGFAEPTLLTAFWALEMWVNGGSVGGQQVTLTLTSGGTTLGFVNLGDYTNNLGIPQYNWMRIQIPFADFKVQNTLVDSFDGFFMEPAYSGFMGILSMDDIKLTDGQACLSTTTDVFWGDSLASGWLDWSYGSYDDMTNTSPVSSGTNSIYLRMFDNGGIYFHCSAGIDTSVWYGVSFDIDNQGDLNPPITVGVSANNAELSTLPLANFYGGQFPQSTTTNGFVTVVIPFSALGVYPGSMLDGFEVKAITTNYLGKLFLDNMQLVKLAPQDAVAGSDDSAGALSYSVSWVALVATIASFLFL